MNNSTTLSTEEALKKYNSCRGKFIKTTEDLTYDAKLLKTIIMIFRAPEGVTFDISKGDLELFT